MRPKKPFRCRISGYVCPAHDDYFEERCSLYEDESHIETREDGTSVHFISDWCKHAIVRDDLEDKISLPKSVIDDLKREYEKATKNPTVYDPTCYALYHTWRKYDAERKKKGDKSWRRYCRKNASVTK